MGSSYLGHNWVIIGSPNPALLSLRVSVGPIKNRGAMAGKLRVEYPGAIYHVMNRDPNKTFQCESWLTTPCKTFEAESYLRKSIQIFFFLFNIRLFLGS